MSQSCEVLCLINYFKKTTLERLLIDSQARRNSEGNKCIRPWLTHPTYHLLVRRSGCQEEEIN